jgi:prevent-host-death family protein
MERSISATETRVRFGEMIRRVVEGGETLIVERSGRPQVVILSIAQYERLKMIEDQNGSWSENLERLRRLVKSDLAGRQLPPAEEIIQKMREDRDGQLVDLR